VIAESMAAANQPDSHVPWLRLDEDYDRIRDHIARVVEGFENFNERVRAPGGFHLRNAARERDWQRIGGRARFIAHALDRDDGAAVDGDQLTLTTIRSHDQYNTTVYGLRDRYRGIDGERRVLFVCAEDLKRLGLADGQHVDIVSVWSDGERLAPAFRLVEYDIPRGCVAAYYPETNVLVPLGHHADGARTPASKSIPVRLRPAAAPPPASRHS